MPVWTVGNARTQPEKQGELALLWKSRYGLNERTELSINLLGTIFAPNVSIKRNWLKKKKSWYLSTRHALYTPYTGMIILEKRNYNEYVADPKLNIIMTNELLFSKWLKKATTCTFPNHLLTITAGFKYPFMKNENYKEKPDSLLIKNEYLYLQTVPIYPALPIWYFAVDLDGFITESMNYAFDVEFYSKNWNIDSYILQNKGLLIFGITKNIRLAAGYQLYFTNKIGVSPLFDLIWNFRRTKKDDRKLFDKKMKIKLE